AVWGTRIRRTRRCPRWRRAPRRAPPVSSRSGPRTTTRTTSAARSSGSTPRASTAARTSTSPRPAATARRVRSRAGVTASRATSRADGTVSPARNRAGATVLTTWTRRRSRSGCRWPTSRRGWVLIRRRCGRRIGGGVVGLPRTRTRRTTSRRPGPGRRAGPRWRRGRVLGRWRANSECGAEHPGQVVVGQRSELVARQFGQAGGERTLQRAELQRSRGGFGRGDTGALDEDRGRVRGGAGPLVGVDLDADQLDLVGDRLGLLLARDLIGERQGVAGVRHRDGLSQCFVIAEELGHGAL